MNTSVLYLLIACALLIIAILGAVAAHYLKKVKRKEQENKEALAYLEEKISQQKAKRLKSINIIAQGLVDEQLTLTEGAIRLSGLLGSMEHGEVYREDFSAFFLLANAAAHIPVLEEWKALPIKKKMGFDNERTKLESDHREFVVDASQRLLKDGRFKVEGTAFYQV